MGVAEERRGERRAFIVGLVLGASAVVGVVAYQDFHQGPEPINLSQAAETKIVEVATPAKLVSFDSPELLLRVDQLQLDNQELEAELGQLRLQLSLEAEFDPGESELVDEDPAADPPSADCPFWRVVNVDQGGRCRVQETKYGFLVTWNGVATVTDSRGGTSTWRRASAFPKRIEVARPRPGPLGPSWRTALRLGVNSRSGVVLGASWAPWPDSRWFRRLALWGQVSTGNVQELREVDSGYYVDRVVRDLEMAGGVELRLGGRRARH